MTSAIASPPHIAAGERVGAQCRSRATTLVMAEPIAVPMVPPRTASLRNCAAMCVRRALGAARFRCGVRGLSNSEIAGTLQLSEGTVKGHVNRILAKLDLRDRVQVVIVGYHTGLVSLD
jgi:DNA-binding CsgD family transcriptional regulator